MMRKIYSLLFIVAIASTAKAQTTISQWNFNAESTAPTTGAGTITLLGGVTEGYATGNDVATGTTDRALNLSTFPADGTASGTAGIRVNVNTANYTGITVSYDRKGSNTASRWEQFEYTTDGTNWIVLGNNGGSTTNVGAGILWPTTTYTLPAAAANNDNFGFRMTSIFQPSTSAYQPIGATQNYGSGGTWRFDNITVRGTSLRVNDNQIAGLKLFPNPVTNGTLNVTTDLDETKEVVVYDLLGKQVVKASTSQAVNVSNLKTGVYMVKITEAGKTATRKLVIK